MKKVWLAVVTYRYCLRVAKAARASPLLSRSLLAGSFVRVSESEGRQRAFLDTTDIFGEEAR